MNHIQYSCPKSHAVGTCALSSVTSFHHYTIFSAHCVTVHYRTLQENLQNLTGTFPASVNKNEEPKWWNWTGTINV